MSVTIPHQNNVHGAQGQYVGRSRSRSGGMSLVELLFSLAISAVLLTALAVCTSASFHAYARASESASSQSVTRLVMQRMLQMIRTGRLHDAYDPDDNNIALNLPGQDPLKSVGIQMINDKGVLVKMWWAVDTDYFDSDLGNLWYQEDAEAAQPLVRNVRVQRDAGDPYVFTLASRSSDDGLLLSLASIYLVAEPAVDRTLALERNRSSGKLIPIYASTSPRRNLD